MRGIPKRLRTREDVYNVAMDLPVEKAREWLIALEPSAVAGIMTAEELSILKSQVAVARWPSNAVAERMAALRVELSGAVSDMKTARSDHDLAVHAANRAGQRMRESADRIKDIEQRLEALGELDDAVQAQIQSAMDLAAAVRRVAASGDNADPVNAVFFLRGADHG